MAGNQLRLASMAQTARSVSSVTLSMLIGLIMLSSFSDTAMRWLPTIEDALPAEARRVETCAAACSTPSERRGCQLMILSRCSSTSNRCHRAARPGLRTFKLVDQVPGRTMGVRADMTPQVTRIDAHLLNRRGVSVVLLVAASARPCRPASPAPGNRCSSALILRYYRASRPTSRSAVPGSPGAAPAPSACLAHRHRAAASSGPAPGGLWIPPGREEGSGCGLLQAKDIIELRRMLADVSGAGARRCEHCLNSTAAPEVLAEAPRIRPDAEIAGPLRPNCRRAGRPPGELRSRRSARLPLSQRRGVCRLRCRRPPRSPSAAATTASARRSGRTRPATGFSLTCAELAWHLPPAAPGWCWRRRPTTRGWPPRSPAGRTYGRGRIAWRCQDTKELGTKPAATGNW